MRVRTNLYWNTLLRVPSRIINFGISIIVARILMPRDYGTIGVAMMLIGYANLFTNFGFNEAIIQKRITDQKTLNSIFMFDLGGSLLFATAFFFLSNHLAEFFKTPESGKVIRLMSLVFPLTSFSALPHAMLRRDMNFKGIAILEISQSLLMYAITLLLAIKGLAYWALVYGQLISLFIITIALCIKAQWVPRPYFRISLLRPIYDFGAWSFLSSQLDFVSQHLDRFVVARWMGPVRLGLYDKSMSMAIVPHNSVVVHFSGVMFATFCKSKESKAELHHYLTKSLLLLSLTVFPIYIGLITIAPHFVNALLGEKWNAMILPFQIILFGFCFKSLHGLFYSFNVATGNYRKQSFLVFISVILFGLSCFTLLKVGLIGVALSFVVFTASSFILSASLAISKAGMSWIEIIKHLTAGGIPTFIMGAILFGGSWCFANDNDISMLVIKSGIGVLVYTAAIFCLRSGSVRDLRTTLLRDIVSFVTK